MDESEAILDIEDADFEISLDEIEQISGSALESYVYFSNSRGE